MKSLLTLCITLATLGAAHAQNVTVDFQSIASPIEASPFKINSSWQVRLEYNLPTGTYTNTKIELTLPDAATHPILKVLNVAAPNAWTAAASNISPTQRKHTFTLTDVTAASTISGAIILTVRGESGGYIGNDRYFTKTGTPFPFVARLTGTLNGATPFDVSANNSQPVVGQATTHWQLPMSPYYHMNDRINGDNVFVVRYDLRAFVCGNAPLAGSNEGYGLPIHVKLGAKLHFLRSWWGGNGGFWPSENQTGLNGSISQSPIPFGTLGHTPGGSIDARWDTPLAANGDGGCDFTHNFYVDLVFECTGSWNESDPDYQMQVVDQDDNQLPVQATQLTFDGTPTFVPMAPITSTNINGTTSCGGPLKVTKLNDNKASPASNIDWQIHVTMPVGGLPNPGTIIVDRLPPDTTSPFNLWMLRPINALAQTTIWACDLRSEPGVAYFDNAAFATYKNNGKCRAAVPQPTYPVQWTIPPGDMTDVTHVVWALPDDVTLQEDGVARTMTFQLQTYVPATQASSYTNCAQLTGTVGGVNYTDTALEPFGTPEPPSSNDPAEDCATKSIPAFSCLRLEAIKDTPQVMSPGSCGLLYFRTYRHNDVLNANNPSFEIELPPGIIVKNAPGGYTNPDGDGVHGSCVDGSVLGNAPFVAFSPSPVGNGVDPLTAPTRVRVDIDRDPACGISTWSFNYDLEFCIAEDWPWANGQALEFSMQTVAADNLGTIQQCNSVAADGYSWTAPTKTSFTLSVPPEIRSFVAPVCQSDGAGAAFVVDGLNTGGVDLPEASLTFTIPDGATFQSIEDILRPPGSLYEVSSDGSAWSTLGTLSAASVRYVRLTNVTLPALVDNRMSYRVLVSATGSEDVLTGRSSLTVRPSVIGTPATGVGYFEDGSCAPVTLTKYHDLDGDDVQDPTEPVLSGWAFVITTSEGGFVASGTTDASGTWSVILPSGDYIASEVLPAEAQDAPTWTSTSSLNWAFNVDIGHDALAHAFGNLCECDEVDDDLCTTRNCERTNGQGRIASASDYACRAKPIDCGGSACAPIDCDPEVGCVDAPFEACSPMVYFLPARDTNTNRLVAFRCEVPTDGVSPPICATDSNGQLLVFPDQGGACGGGVRE